MLSSVKHFADTFGYQVWMLWGVTGGVSHCRFAELFAPVPGVKVIDMAENAFDHLADKLQGRRSVVVGQNTYAIFRPGDKPTARVFSWDLHCGAALARIARGKIERITVQPSIPLYRKVEQFAAQHTLSKRIGIRVRVEEIMRCSRRPRRILGELNSTIQSISRIPWFARVFVATDSEYVQTMIRSHFPDTVYIPKDFNRQEVTGRYIDRQDKKDMFNFLTEWSACADAEESSTLAASSTTTRSSVRRSQRHTLNQCGTSHSTAIALR